MHRIEPTFITSHLIPFFHAPHTHTLSLFLGQPQSASTTRGTENKCCRFVLPVPTQTLYTPPRTVGSIANRSPEHCHESKTMSIFRSRLGGANERADADSAGGVFKAGDVVERAPSAPAALVSCGAHKAGFPGLRPSRYLGSASSVDGRKHLTMPLADRHRPGPDSADNFSAENLKTVLSMTPEQVSAALAEAKMHLSEESLNFLQRRGESSVTSQPGAFVQEPLVRPPAVADPHPTAPRGDELSWMDPDFESDPLHSRTTRILGDKVDRFDLEGRKIISKSEFLSHFSTVMTNDSLFRMFREVPSIESVVFDAISCAGDHFFTSAKDLGVICCDGSDNILESDLRTNLVDRELFHHEYEHLRAGYSLDEACEV